MFEVIPLAGMLFALLMTLIIGGFILLFPLTKRLGQLLEMRLEERREGTLPPEEAAALVEMVESLRAELDRLEERQQFTERLLDAGTKSGAGEE